MAVGRLGGNIGIKEDLIKKLYAQALKAHKSPEKPYLLEKKQSQVIISFPGSSSVSDWYAGKPFGETKINLNLFPSLRSIGNDEAALVNEAFLRRFEIIQKNQSFLDEVKKAVRDRKQIVFTGHSSGAPIAVLAALFTLESNFNQIPSLFCVTFGSPLVGNFIFSHATRRENWSRYFVHFVMRYDIVPRIMLTPLSSIEQALENLQVLEGIFQFFTPKSKSSVHDSIGRSGVASGFFTTVMRNTATVTSHAACTLMGSTNLLLETVTNFVDLSPYRPFGTYIFCTGNGKLVVVKNPDAILQLLFFSAQLTAEAEVSEVARKSLQQHLDYESELQGSLEMQDVVYLEQLEELPLNADGSNSDAATINSALNDLGLSTRARLCLRAAGELEKQKSRNEGKINEKKGIVVAKIKQLEDYRTTCEISIGYYDAFKLQKDTRDFHANVWRLELAGVWDEIIEMLKRYDLPDEFEAKPEWIELATTFRRLLEPLDIANYYRHLKNEDTGPYMIRARPKRYRYTQRWVEHANRVKKGAAESTMWVKKGAAESTMWAEVEELCSRTNKSRSFQEIKDKVVQLEEQIKQWTETGDLQKDVFLKETTLVKWWKTLPEEHRAGSCIASLISV